MNVVRTVPGWIGAGLWLWLAAAAIAEPYPSPEDPFVTDLSGVIPDDTEARIEDTLKALRSETGVEMTVVTIPSRKTYDPSPSIEAFATGLFNTWGIGNKDRDDGILALIVTDDREMRLELGAGYDKGFDAVAQSVIDRAFLPRFKTGDYAGGIEAGTRETIDRIARRNAANLAPEPMGGTGLISWLVWGFVGLIGGLVVFGSRLKAMALRMTPCPQCGSRTLSRVTEDVIRATEDQEGLRNTITTCSTCGYRSVVPTTVSRTSRRRGGSGFGGGKSSGGGASGRW